MSVESSLLTMCNILVPAGTMVHFAGKSIPTGWLLCNGAAISRTTYARLYSAIGTTWGTGDGSTTFNLPNTNGRFLEGTTTTSNVGTALSAGLPNITGEDQFECVDTANYSGALSGNADKTNYGGTTNSGGILAGWSGLNLNASNSSSIYGNSTTVQPNAVYTLIIIKV